MLIAFEGIDGSGKSTQAAMLVKWLEAAPGREVVFSKEPTGGPWGTKLRQSFVTKRLSPDEELQCFVNDRREHVAQLLGPALARGAIVVIDRYYYSTVAYQGARGLDPAGVLKLNESFAPRPRAVFLVDLEPQVALDRISARAGGRDLLENLDEQLKVREAFLELARTQGNFVLIDGRQSVDQMHAQIVGEMKRLL
ncbi:MAG: dTMP kinase [Myxococcaceae bacterium]|nr:dTMP kinase [Myxococcaceae bacterium]